MTNMDMDSENKTCDNIETLSDSSTLKLISPSGEYPQYVSLLNNPK